MSVHLCADPGSTHLGDRKMAKEIIKVCKENGADSVKFQLFWGHDYPANIELNRDLFQELVSYGRELEIPVTASAFDTNAINLLIKLGVPYIKFAHSQRHNSALRGLLNTGKRVVVTTNEADRDKMPDSEHLTILYTDTINGETVYNPPWMTDFEGKFPLFDGYSDHHRGIGHAIEAVKAGAKWIEKHFSLQYDACKAVPDFPVSMSPRDLYELARAIK